MNSLCIALQKLLIFLRHKYQCIWKTSATTVNEFVISSRCLRQLSSDLFAWISSFLSNSFPNREFPHWPFDKQEVIALVSIWDAMRENIPSDMFIQRRLKSACASAQSEEGLRLPHEYPWHPKMRPVKILISLRECAGWSESSLGSKIRRCIFWHSRLFRCYKYFWDKPFTYYNIKISKRNLR